MINRVGYVYGIAAYVCWGTFPLFFMLLAAVSPFEVVPWRVITALVFCVLVVTAMRGWATIVGIFRSPRMLAWFAVSALLLYANWQIFVVGIVTGHIIETSLGYFINPLVTILIGVVVRKERLSRLQWVAVAVAACGVVISAIAYGQFPLIALGLAFSFASYGAVRKQVSEDIDALTGLTVETVFGAIIAVVQLLFIVTLVGHLDAFDYGPAVTVPLLLSGAVTAVPLLLFAAGNRRLPLSHMGFIQFITPVLGFLTGYFVFHEEMPPARWIGFITVWVALILLIIDIFTRLNDSKRTRKQEIELAATSEIPVQPGP